MEVESALVSIVLLSHDRPGYLKDALSSVVQQTHRPIEIIVVDNQSPSTPEIETIIARYPSVKLLRNSVNLGFCRAMNRGIEAASGEYVYLTEDDMILERDCISQLVEYMDTHPSTGLTSGIIYNKHQGTIRSAGGDVHLGAIFRMTIWGADQQDEGQFRQPFDVTFIAGAMVFGRLGLLKRLKGFREEFFMYEEDVELCARVSKLGYRIVVIPQAKAHHFEPREGPTPETIEFHKLKNFFALHLLHCSSRVLLQFCLRYFLLYPLRRALADRRQWLLWAKVWWWILSRAPFYVVERHRLEARIRREISRAAVAATFQEEKR